MLIKFSVSNFRSIKERQVLDMRAVEAYKEHPDHLLKGFGFSESALKTMSIYGSNGSGKSNLLKALRAMELMVLRSAKLDPDEEIKWVEPFIFDQETKSGDSEFEIEFVEGESHYQYGFCVNRKQVTEEWLFVTPLRLDAIKRAKASRLFYRHLNDDGVYEYAKFSPLFKGNKKTIEELALPNKLFLSAAIQVNNPLLKPIHDWFMNKLMIISSSEIFMSLEEDVSKWIVSNVDEKEYRKQRVLDFIQELDCGRDVFDIHIDEVNWTPPKFPSDLPDELKNMILSQNQGKLDYKTYFMHPDLITGELIPLELKQESNGTRALYGFSRYFFQILDNDAVLIIDELDTSLHPLLVRQIVKMFHSQSKSAQLIFTTHDVSLLNEDVFRRDQILLLDKKNQQTIAEPLSDYALRKGESLEKGYLTGRYGAIPFFNNI